MKNLIPLLAMATLMIGSQAHAQEWENSLMTKLSSLSYDGNRVYATAFYPSSGVTLYISDNQGETWTEHDDGLKALIAGAQPTIAPIFVASGGRIITSLSTNSGHSLIYSDNGGNSWQTSGLLLSGKLLTISETDGTLFAKAYLSSTAYYSTDRGATWSEVPNRFKKFHTVGGYNAMIYLFGNDSLFSINSNDFSLISAYPTQFKSSKTRALKAYGTHFFHILTDGTLYHSADMQNWDNIHPPKVPSAHSVYDVQLVDSVLFVASSSGHVRTSDFGKNYTNYGSLGGGLRMITVTLNYVIVGEHEGSMYGSVYRIKYSDATELPAAPAGPASLQAYPVPLAHTLHIGLPPNFTSGGHLRLTNPNGKCLAHTQVYGHTASLPTGHLPPGVYFLVFENESQKIIHRVVK
ncbi:MAG: T9SS type A sorting domain-containing protein [Bacteroidetes bacterium]|nr:T9SS type A sorting domain-containing protein [Bacteroidota bacterium]